MRRIYLDYNATTPISPEVRESLQPFLAEHFGNPSSDHVLGRACSEAISDAREQLAALIGAEADDIVYTGGGTESNNLALKGLFLSADSPCQGHLIISSVEHPATSVPAHFLAKLGVQLTVVPCDGTGRVDPDDVKQAIRPDTRLVSIMLANNEVGTIQPIAEIVKICREREVLCHTDAAQAAGKIRVDVNELGVDLLSIAAHKLYAPKGIGALFVREGVDLEPLLHGAGHERGLRAGTENTPYIVGLGRAAKLAAARLAEESFDSRLRDDLWTRLRADVDGLQLNGSLELGLPNTLHVSFPGVVGHELLARAPELCASTGAACHGIATKPSATLTAMGLSAKAARGAVRLSTGWYTTEDDVATASALLAEAWRQLR